MGDTMGMSFLHISALLVLTILSVSACQSGYIAMPIHHEPLGTDLGGDYLAGELRVEDGCLKLYRIGWDSPNRTTSQQLHDVWLPVWPQGFSLRHEGGEIHIVGNYGDILASAGDTVRLGGGNVWSGGTPQQKLEETIPNACQDLYYFVGDEVSIVPLDEARVVSLPGSTLWFPRNNTGGGGPRARMLAKPPEDKTLFLDGDCLRIGEGGPVIIWPAGFYPDIKADRVMVRNGSGRLIATVGQKMYLDSGGYIPGSSGSCHGPLWGNTRFLEAPKKP